MSKSPVLGRDLQLRQIACYHGPNIWSMEPVLVGRITIAPEFGALCASGAVRLAQLYGEWIDESLVTNAGAAPSETVGKIVARWALGALNEQRGYLHEADARDGPDGLILWVGFHHPRLTGMALELAVRALALASSREDFSADLMAADLEELWQNCRLLHPDYQARILMKAARLKDIPVLPFLSGTKFWQYGWGVRSRVFMESLSNADGHLAHDLSRDKPLSKAAFTALGMPTPEHVIVTDEAQLENAATEIGYPCVVKPLDMGGGKGITAGVQTETQLRQAYDYARKVTPGPLMVEQFVPGDEHRLMVIDGKMVAAIRRAASVVVGDGKSTIRQLIHRVNADRPRNLVRARYRLSVAIDDGLQSHLATQAAEMDTVPAHGREIVLRSTSNLSMGGLAVDVTDLVHPAVTALAEQLAMAVGLGTAGLDYLTTDIASSPLEGHGAFIEMNTTPGIDVAIAAGRPEEVIGTLVLGELPGRIPVDLCVLPTLDGPAARGLLGEPSNASGMAWVCGDQLRVGSLELRVTHRAPWAAVRCALRNKTVASLQIVCTADYILTHGLPVDRLDRVVLAGVSFPAPWQGVIDQAAREVVFSSGMLQPETA